MKPTLVDEFDHYSAWRDAVRLRVETLRDWLSAQELADAESDLHLDQLLGRLQEDTLNVAFVAEFSRGKSELINAIFFSDYRQRVLPSSAGRTTMCPTELSYSPALRPSLRLLPIHTRTREGSIADFKREPDSWTEFPLNLDSAEEMSATLMHLADTIEVDPTTAVAYGLMLHHCLEAAQRLEQDHDISVEVIDVRTINPLDKQTILASVRKTGKAIVVYEDNRTYGAGAEIVATIAEEAMFDLDGPLVRIGGPDVPAMGFASNLEHAFMPDADHIYDRMVELARF